MWVQRGAKDPSMRVVTDKPLCISLKVEKSQYFTSGTPMQIIDHTKQLDIMLEAYNNREKYKQNLQKSNQKVEIIKKDYAEMDGYSFAVVKVKRGDIVRTGYEIIVKEGNKEYHFISAEENNGSFVELEVLQDIIPDENKNTATISVYVLSDDRLSKVVSGRYSVSKDVIKEDN
jgi:acetyl/propionyl-CoA carboxylase alpha subunit